MKNMEQNPTDKFRKVFHMEILFTLCVRRPRNVGKYAPTLMISVFDDEASYFANHIHSFINEVDDMDCMEKDNKKIQKG